MTSQSKLGTVSRPQRESSPTRQRTWAALEWARMAALTSWMRETESASSMMQQQNSCRLR